MRQALRDHGRRGLLDLCEDLAQGREVLLFIDQFEEVFASGVARDERESYLDLLTPGPEEEPGQLRVLLTVRSEFQNAMLSRDGFNEPVEQGLCPLRTMKPDEIAQAVVVPACRVNVGIEPALLERIQREIRPEGKEEPLPGFLPLLSFAMNQLWSQASGRELTLAVWENKLGGLAGALGNHAESAFATLSEEDRAVAESLFDLLVEARDDGTDTRLTVLRDSLSDDQRRVVDSFANARLLTTDRDSEDRATVEIAHETLMQHWQRLRQQIEVQRRFLLWRTHIRSLMADWQARDQDPGSLLAGKALEEAEQFAQSHALEESMRDFITRSRATESARDIWERVLVDSAWCEAVTELASADRATRSAFARETFAKQVRIGLITDTNYGRRQNFQFVVRALVATDLAIRSEVLAHADVAVAHHEDMALPTLARGMLATELEVHQPDILLHALSKTDDPYQCAALGQAIAAMTRGLPEPAAIETILEGLRWPLTVGKATEHLLDAARTRFAPDLSPEAGYWDFVVFVGQRFPEIELRVPD